MASFKLDYSRFLCHFQMSSSSEALLAAVESGDTFRVLDLLQSGVPMLLDSDGQTALHLAAARGRTDMVEALIQAGCDVGVQDFVSVAHENTAFCMHYCCYHHRKYSSYEGLVLCSPVFRSGDPSRCMLLRHRCGQNNLILCE